MRRRPPRSTIMTHSFPTRRSSDLQQRAVLPEHFIVEVDADHRVAAEACRLGLHLGDRFLARAGEDVLIFARAPADDVGDRREQVAEQIGADDHLAGDDAQIFAERTALDLVGGGSEHIRFPLAAEWGTFWSGCFKGMVKQWQTGTNV